MTRRDDDRGRGSDMDWGGQGNGYRGQSSRQDQFSDRYGGQYGQGYGQDYAGESYGREGFGRAPGGWQPNAEQGWGSQGRTQAGSWGQNQSWGQVYSNQGSWGQGQSQQGFGEQRSGGQARLGGAGGAFSYEEIWRIPGSHSGRGPRGYQRKDQRIEEDICERLTHHGQIDASDIAVKVQNGEVTLTGTVESRRAKRMTEDMLDSISGIKDVHNQLRVQQGQGQMGQQGQSTGQTQMSQGSTEQNRGQSRNPSQRNETAKAGASSA